MYCTCSVFNILNRYQYMGAPHTPATILGLPLMSSTHTNIWSTQLYTSFTHTFACFTHTYRCSTQPYKSFLHISTYTVHTYICSTLPYTASQMVSHAPHTLTYAQHSHATHFARVPCNLTCTSILPVSLQNLKLQKLYQAKSLNLNGLCHQFRMG